MSENELKPAISLINHQLIRRLTLTYQRTTTVYPSHSHLYTTLSYFIIIEYQSGITNYLPPESRFIHCTVATRSQPVQANTRLWTCLKVCVCFFFHNFLQCPRLFFSAFSNVTR